MYVCVIGDVNHDDVTDTVINKFSKITKESKNGLLPVSQNLERPIYTPSTINIRDDDIELAYAGVFTQVPGYANKL
jgi:predicted Zn-dependent peptidase